MSSFLRTFTAAVFCCCFLSFGCSKKVTLPTFDETFPVTCIGILPALSMVDFDDTLSTVEDKELLDGTRVLDSLLREQFVGKSGFRLVSNSQISGMDANLPAQPMARAMLIAEKLSCNAVLETTLRRYKDRVGGEYTAKESASVAFDYRLIAIPDGTVLCSGTFDEVQKSVMANFFHFRTAADRGFTWVTAEQLLREGMQEKFKKCSYLSAEE